jgi:tetratricopeptide (TPR) repeat protein
MSLAERLALSLRGDGHTVFFDQSDIAAGEEYDARIRNAIERCDLFVFLISPESVAPDSYPLAELDIAEARWPVPEGHVLPLVTKPVDLEHIPPYLRAVSVFDPQGDFVAESSAAIARIAKTRRGQFRPRQLVGIAILLLAVIGVWLTYSRIQHGRETREQIARVITEAKNDLEAHAYPEAFEIVDKAKMQFPGDSELQKMQQQIAMSWLRNIRVTVGEQTFSQIVAKLRPVLSSGAAASSGQEAGDLLAHLGWCEYLRARDFATDADPESYFKKAVAADPSNAYAHSMWGFWLLYKNDAQDLPQAQQHFDLAVKSNRDRLWVRNLQIAALLQYYQPAKEREAIRVANAMRLEGASIQDPTRLWSVYEQPLVRGQDMQNFLDLLPPDQHIATFKWLFPETSFSDSKLAMYRLMLGRLEEAAGHRENAMASYELVEQDFRRSKSTGPLLDRALEGIARLSKSRQP